MVIFRIFKILLMKLVSCACMNKHTYVQCSANNCHCSTGSSVYRALLKLLATVLVLKALALNFPSQFPLVFTPKIGIAGKVDIQFENGVKKAVDFVSNAERVNPGLPSRLELGYNWDAACNRLLEDCQL